MATADLNSTSTKDERKSFPFLEMANFCNSNSSLDYSNDVDADDERQQCRSQQRSLDIRNSVNFFRFVTNYTSYKLDSKNYSDGVDDGASCYVDERTDVDDDAGHDLNKTVNVCRSSFYSYSLPSSMNLRFRFLPLFSSLLLCFMLFVTSSSIGLVDGAQGSKFQPPNITIGGPGSHYKRFNEEGQSTKVNVEIVLNISESTSVGTVISNFLSYDKKQGDLAGTNYTFLITHESDVYRQFSIGNKDGVLRIAKPLDREVIPSYRLFIKVIDQSGNEGYTVVNINVGDVNDNAPYLNLSKQLIIWENDPPQFIGIVTCYDPDGPDNGPPFFMSQANNSTYTNLISVVFDQYAFNGNGAINVSSKITLDREGDQGKFLYVPIYVRDVRGLSAIRYLPIEIGDRNDNPMTDGSSTIHVYNYNGEIPETVIGRVYVTDLDDWDAADKTFAWQSTPPTYFTLTKDGQIVLQSSAPIGTYTLSINVTDTARKETAIGSVTVKVDFIDDNAIKNSGSIRIRGISAERFLRPYPGKGSPYENFRTALAKYLNVDVNLVQIFTILPVQPVDQMPPIIDVYFCVLRAPNQGNAEYFSPVYLTGVIEQNRIDIEGIFDVSNSQIIQVNIDPCIQEMCTEGGCTRVLNVNATPSVIMANRTSLVGVNLNVTTSCQCPREIVTQTCTSDSCYNGGICHNAQSGYFCECRGSYNNGSRCEGRTRSFNSRGYAWVKPIGSCDNFTISMEFMTTSSNATLLFNGPMQNGRDYDVYIPDFIAILLVNGRLIVQVNLGGGTTTFQFNNSLTPAINDGEWHVVDVIASQRDFEIILDRCKNITGPSTSNKNALLSCRVAGVVGGSNEQLNVDDPLQIGGMAGVDGSPFNLTLVNSSLVGCLRNLVVNGELYDLHDVINSENSDVGCSLTNKYCYLNGAPICVNGECVASLSGAMRCVCEIGWYGDACDQATQWKTFGQSSYVQYNFAGPSQQAYNKIQVLFLPTRLSQGYLQYAGVSPYPYVGVDIVNANIEFDYNLGSGSMSIQPPVKLLASNISYFVEVDRYWTYSRITIDGLSDPYAAFRVGGPDEKGWMNYSSLNFFLGAASTNPSTDDFQGCIKEFMFNDIYVPITDTGKYTSVVNQQGVTDGCSAFGTCASLTCASGLVCQEFWKGAFCTCPSGVTPMLSNDGTIISCGTNAAALHLGITRGALVAILISLLALILLVLLLVVWRCRKHDNTAPDDELIGDVRDYREEGGGEEDQSNYNIGPLRKPVIPNEREIQLQRENPVGGGVGSLNRSLKARTGGLKPDGDLDAFILGKIGEAELDPSGPPFDELRIYAVEFDGVSVCSLSSLESAGSDIDWDELNEWGPRFRNLADLYGGEEDD